MQLPTSSFVRPADILAYSDGDLVANDTVAGSVVVPTFPVSIRGVERFTTLNKVQLRKSGTSITDASFRVHLFGALPTNIVNGDNAAFAVDGVHDYLGSVDITFSQAFGDGAWGIGANAFDTGLVFSEVGTVHWLLEALAAYTPESEEEFWLTAEIFSH